MREDWRLRVLIGCEHSAMVRTEFARRGWLAMSADLLPSEKPAEVTHYPDGSSVWEPASAAGNGQHYQGDVRDLFSWHHPLNAERHQDCLASPSASVWGIPPLWDLAVLHPPCTDLSYAGAVWFKKKQTVPPGRDKSPQQEAADFFMEMVNAPSPLVAVENPHCIMQRLYQPPTQIVQPWHFGDPYVKGIHLWLKGLPPLVADHAMDDYPELFRVATGGGSWRTDKAAARKNMSAYEDGEGRVNRAKVRSRTMPGLARVMAEQWGAFAEDYYYESRWLPARAG